MKGFQDFGNIFQEETGLRLATGLPLSAYSSFRIGGPADYFLEVRELADFLKAVQTARKYRCPFFVIGGGYNLLFDDAGYRGLIIRNLVSGLSWNPDQGWIEAFSGTELSCLVNKAVAQGLGGLEFLAGIPGTVGGAIYGNAGAFGQAIGDRVVEVVAIGENGHEIHLDRGSLKFDYRYSALKDSPRVVLKVRLKIESASSTLIRKRVEEYLEKRKAKHPPEGTACAGSFFKNPVLPDGQKIPAGKLLEQAGARGLKVGQAAVYPGHCNFIINLGGATASEVLTLAAVLKEKVWKNSGIRLEEEVIFVSATASML
jgi:UDP-N-acetylmuramate dehydrogenase